MDPQDLAFADTARWRFDVEKTVDASVADVWAAFVDNESWMTWFVDCRDCRATSTPFDGVGSSRHIEVGPLKVDERFIAWEPNRLWAFTATAMKPAFARSLVERATFTEPAAGRTTIQYRIAVEPTWWAVPMRAATAKRMTASFATSLDQLGDYLTTSGSSETHP